MDKLQLAKTYAVGNESFSAVELRDPVYSDYRQLGAPFDVQRGVLLRDRDVAFAYIDRLVTKPAAGALQILDVADAMALEDHIITFFISARMSRASSKNSSSASDGPRNTSTD